MLTLTSFEQIWKLQTNSDGLKCNQNTKDKDFQKWLWNDALVHPKVLLPTPKGDHLRNPIDIIRF